MKLIILFCFLLVACAYGFSNRIVGGQNSTIEQHPYLAVLLLVYYDDAGEYRMLLGCGSSILSPKYLLSAAHCVTDFTYTYVRVGSNYPKEGGQLLRVAEYIKHPLYDETLKVYDFSIIVLEDGDEIVFSPTVQPITLSGGPNPEVDSMVNVAGWGVISVTPYVEPDILQEVDLPVWSNSRCLEIYPYLTDPQMCLGGTPEGGTSACYGDSGSPVVQGTPPIQYAVVTAGNSCSAPGIPGIYARVTFARAWITEITGI